MAFSHEDFNNPILMFDSRTRQLRVRIQTLSTDMVVAKHPFSRAVILEELNKSTDIYVARSIQEGNSSTD